MQLFNSRFHLVRTTPELIVAGGNSSAEVV